MTFNSISLIERGSVLERLLAAGHLLLIAVTWPLWIPQTRFPQVPLIRLAGQCPRIFEWSLLIILLTSLLLLFVANSSRLRRFACLASVICSFSLILIDQHRLQPWAWEFLLVAAILATADSATGRQCWRWLIIGVYAWSAWSKMDYGFCLYHGPFLLEGIAKSFHLPHNAAAWPTSVRCTLAGVIPVFEMLVACGLIFQKTRRPAVIGAAIMHLGLLLSLGPLGHNHRPGVLCWNLFFLAQNWILFRSFREEKVTGIISDSNAKTPGAAPRWSGNLLAQVIVMAALIWPGLEPLGLCDHWPAWAVYAAKPERVTMLLHADELKKLPAELRQYVQHNSITEEWRSFRIDRWSLDAVWVPLYPQDRFQVGVILAIVDEFQLEQVQVVIERPANRWTGERIVRSYDNLESVKELTLSYRWNALPRVRK